MERPLLIMLMALGLATLLACRTQPATLRVATFNIKEFSLEKIKNVDSRGMGQDAQLRAAAAIIQRIRPDILVINEIDHAYGGDPFDADCTGPAQAFIQAYLKTGDAPIDYPYVFAAPCNTGIPTGKDLNGDGYTAKLGDPRSSRFAADCFGWGAYPGQYSMALLSRFHIDAEAARTFQTFLWQDLPGNHLPTDFYGDKAPVLRLSSKSHWDVPIRVGDWTLRMLMSHPTPPGFDGDEDRNGRRNFDELNFWVRYLEDDPALVDDAGVAGGLIGEGPFLFAGDFNADPADAAAYEGVTAIGQLLHHPQVRDTGDFLTSAGGAEGRQAGPPHHPERYTAKFGQDNRMRIDYLLPSKGVEVTGGGVFWPSSEDDPQGAALADRASDHRLVWLDLRLPQSPKSKE